MINSINYFNTWIASYMRARFGRTERGASLVEYVLLVSLIAVVCITALNVLGGKAKGEFEEVGSEIGG